MAHDTNQDCFQPSSSSCNLPETSPDAMDIVRNLEVPEVEGRFAHHPSISKRNRRARLWERLVPRMCPEHGASLEETEYGRIVLSRRNATRDIGMQAYLQ
jgi:hypothetical protein